MYRACIESVSGTRLPVTENKLDTKKLTIAGLEHKKERPFHEKPLLVFFRQTIHQPACP